MLKPPTGWLVSLSFLIAGGPDQACWRWLAALKHQSWRLHCSETGLSWIVMTALYWWPLCGRARFTLENSVSAVFKQPNPLFPWAINNYAKVMFLGVLTMPKQLVSLWDDIFSWLTMVQPLIGPSFASSSLSSRGWSNRLVPGNHFPTTSSCLAEQQG